MVLITKIRTNLTDFLRDLLSLLRKLLMLLQRSLLKNLVSFTVIFGMWGILFGFHTIMMKVNDGW